MVPLADPVGPAYKGAVDGPSDTRVMKGPAVEVSVRVGGLPVDLLSKRAILLPGHLQVQERDDAILFLIHGELDAAVQPVEVFQEQLELVRTVLSDDKGVIHVAKPNTRLEVSCGDGSLLEFFHDRLEPGI